MEPQNVFAQNLRKERQRLGLSQEALGFRCDLNVSEISRLERSTRDPRLSTITRLAKALGVPAAQLLDGIR